MTLAHVATAAGFVERRRNHAAIATPLFFWADLPDMRRVIPRAGLQLARFARPVVAQETGDRPWLARCKY